VCVWGGVVRCSITTLLLVQLAVTLLQCHTAACSNTQHCLKPPTYYSTSFSTVPRPSRLSDKHQLTSVPVHILMLARGGAGGWGTGLRVRFPMTSFEFYMPNSSSPSMVCG